MASFNDHQIKELMDLMRRMTYAIERVASVFLPRVVLEDLTLPQLEALVARLGAKTTTPAPVEEEPTDGPPIPPDDGTEAPVKP